MKDISLTEMLKAGLHFGHKASKRHPKMAPFIFTTKNGLNIVDLEKTKEQLEKAREVARDLSSKGKVILFISTKKQSKDILEKYAKDCGMPYVSERWTGGLLTNFNHVSRLMKELKRLKREKERGELAKYTKKEQLDFSKEIERLEKLVGGIQDLKNIPDAMFFLDIKEDKTAVKEAQKKKITTLALVDTNNDPEAISYPIPGNNDALKGLEYIGQVMAEAIKEGVAAKPVEAEETKKVEEPKKQEK